MTKEKQLLSLSIAPKIPKDFVSAPIFPAKKQNKPRELMVGNVKWTIGIEHPTKRRTSPALDMRHARACFTLLSFREDKNSLDVLFSMNEFCRRYASSQGGRYSRELLDIIFDLQDTWIERVLPDGIIQQFTILGTINISKRPVRRRDAKAALTAQSELWLDRVTLDENFFNLLVQTARIRIDVLNRIRSPFAQGIYSFIPSRAVHHKEDDPFEITATNLLSQLGENVPKEKRRRKEKFAGKRDGRASIIEHLDNLELISGNLRVDIAETADKTDWKLLFWAENVIESHNVKPLPRVNQSKLLHTYLASGRGDKKKFDSLMKSKKPLHSYHEDLLEQSGIDYGDSADFLMMVLTIIGPRNFQTILAELKGDIIQPGGSGIRDPKGVLIHRLLEAVKTPNS